MNHVNKYSIVLICLLAGNVSYSQKSTDKLKKEQDRLERNIANTKNLLDKTKINTEATLNELKLIDNQVKYREELLSNFDNQIRGTELKIEQKNLQIEQLEAKIIFLRNQYKKLLIYAYKKRSKEGKMMYIFSSTSYYEALKRKKYLEKIAEIQRKQKLIILQHKKLIAKEKHELLEDKSYKEKIAGEKRLEKEQILKDKEVQTKTLSVLKSEEVKLMAKIQQDENKKADINRKIQAAIASEIAKADTKKKPSGTVKPKTDSKPDKVNPILSEPKEVALNQTFESNKGLLPWPVDRGSITESFGKNSHPTIKGLVTFNNGIDISAPKGAQVRAVFEGEVTSVISVPGAGKIVIIKHGNYRTVYSNLQDAYVSVGSKVSTKQAVGSLLAIDGEDLSLAHFELHQVVGKQVNRINPVLWITR